MTTYPSFSDFSEESLPLEGDKVRLDDILNQEIVITGHTIKKSKYSKNSSGKYLTIQFRVGESDHKVLFTGSDVLIDQLEKYQHNIPFTTTIRKINRYYTLT